jgi:plastocyanin
MRSGLKPALLLAVAALLRPQVAQAATIQVTIQNLAFSPAEVSVKVGDTIEWVNKDAFVHTATARDKTFDVNIAANKTARMVVQRAGDIAYNCRFHPNMTGTLKVGGD